MARKKKIVEAEPKIGHNGGPINDERKKQLAGYVSEIERWDAQKAIIVADIGEIYNSAKDAGFDVKAMRAIVKDRKIAKDKRDAFEAVCDVYKHALGMLSDLPLGQATVRSALSAFGTPTDLTDEEKAKGYTHAFIGKDGNRMATDIGKLHGIGQAIAEATA